jgi:hypothetical protein
MDDFTAVARRKLVVERDFECSRLEKTLLEQAYQRIVPTIRRRVGQEVSKVQMPACGSDSRIKPTRVVA